MNKNQNSIFSCIVDTYRKATQAQVAESDSDGISYGVTNPKWNRETLRSIARIGIALEKIANIIQGCLYANGIKKTLCYYQNYCGVQLTTEITVASLVDAMDWTEKYAQACMRTIKPSNPENLPLIEKWLKSYHPEDLFDDEGKLLPELHLQCNKWIHSCLSKAKYK